MLYVIAMEDEKNLLPDNCQYIVTGIGALNVINALKDIDKNEPLCNIGYAGSNYFEVGKRITVGKVSSYHPNVDFEEPCYYLRGDIPCYTSGDFVMETKITEPCVFDMELAYILALGFVNVSAEKVVSDNLSKEEFGKCLKK